MTQKPLSQSIAIVVIGLITTIFLLAAKFVFELTDVERRMEAYGYEVLQSYLPPFTSRENMPVVVVDIGKLEGGTEEHPTPRAKLKEIIGAIAKESPKAIGVDVDFSPEENGGWQDDEDPEFFNYCLSITEKGVPVFLGVDRSLESPPNAWLGLERFKSLAAGMRFQFPDTNRIILWVKPAETSERIPSLSLALAKSYREDLLKPPALFAPMLEDIEDHNQQTETLAGSEFTYSNAIVNYSNLEALESQSLSTISATSIGEHGTRFRNKLVLIGRMSNTDDKHIVVGRNTAIPGILLQASATYTLAKSPLFEFSSRARILIDLILPLFIMIVIAYVRYRNHHVNKYNWHGKVWKAIIVTTALVFVGGIVLVRWAGIIWFDFLVVIMALLLHPLIEKKVEAWLYRWIGRQNDQPPDLENTE